MLKPTDMLWPVYGHREYFQREYLAWFFCWSDAVDFVSENRQRSLYVGAPKYRAELVA